MQRQERKRDKAEKRKVRKEERLKGPTEEGATDVAPGVDSPEGALVTPGTALQPVPGAGVAVAVATSEAAQVRGNTPRAAARDA